MIKAVQVKQKAPPFGVLSIAIARRIDDANQCAAIEAATYKYEAAMRELEQQFEEKASEIRRTFILDVGVANGEMES